MLKDKAASKKKRGDLFNIPPLVLLGKKVYFFSAGAAGASSFVEAGFFDFFAVFFFLAGAFFSAGAFSSALAGAAGAFSSAAKAKETVIAKTIAMTKIIIFFISIHLLFNKVIKKF
jgi:hypothetical protein